MDVIHGKHLQNCESFPFAVGKDRHSVPKNIMFKNFTGDPNTNNCCKVIDNSNAAQAKM